MSAIFTNIYADITPEFQELCTHSFPFPSVIQKVCDMTGAVFIHDRQPKLAGNWQTMKTVHDLLSGLVLYYKVVNEFDLGVRSSRGKASQPSEHEELLIPGVEVGSQAATGPSSNIINKRIYHGEGYQANRQHHDVEDDSEMHYRDVQVITLTEVESDSEDKKNVCDNVGDIDLNNLSPQSWHSPVRHVSNDFEHAASETSVIHVVEPENNYGTDLELNKDSVQFQGSNKETLACSECSYTTQCSRNLLHHRVRVHLRPWKCRSCDKGFGLQKDLQQHYKSLRSCRVYKRPLREPPGRPIPPVKPFYTVVSQESTNTEATITEEDTLSCSKTTTKGPDKSEVQEMGTNSSDNHKKYNADESLEKQVSGIIKLEPFDYESCGETSKESCTSDRPVSYPKTNITDSVSGATKVIKNEQCEVDETDQYTTSPDHDDCSNNIIQASGFLDGANVGSSSRKITIHPHQCLWTNSRSARSSLLVPQPDSAPVDNLQINSTNRGSMCTDQDVTVPWSGDAVGVSQPRLTSINLVQPIVGCEPETPLISCSSCDYKADTTKKVDDHIHRVHFKRFQCSKCPALFGLPKDLTRHYRKTHKMFIESQRRGRKANSQWPY